MRHNGKKWMIRLGAGALAAGCLVMGAALAAGIPAIALIGAAAYFEAALPDVYYAEDPSGFSIRQYRIASYAAVYIRVFYFCSNGIQSLCQITKLYSSAQKSQTFAHTGGGIYIRTPDIASGISSRPNRIRRTLIKIAGTIL